MIDLIYYGTGGYDEKNNAKFNIFLPQLTTGNYEFPNVYNFSKNDNNVILIHMQVTHVDPDYDLSEVDDLRNIIVQPVSFNLNPKTAIKESEVTEIAQNGSSPLNLNRDINVIVYHDDKFELQSVINDYYNKDYFKTKKNNLLDPEIVVPKKTGFGTLKPIK